MALFIAFVLVSNVLDGGKGVMPSALWTAPSWAPWWHAPLRMLANALPSLILGGFVLTLTRRAGLSWVIALAVEALIDGVNALKVENLGAPLLPSDFLMAGQLGGGGGELLASYLPHGPWPYVVIAAFIAAIVLLARYEPPLSGRRWSLRTPAAVVLLAALVSLIGGWSAWSGLYNAKYLGMQPWSPKATRAHTGLVSSLLLFHLKYGGAHDKPDVDAALKLMAREYGQVQQREAAIAAKPDQRPDIVIILSESLFDPTILKGYPDNVDFLPNLHRLARHGISGEMHAPTFGGGTIRTGFEVLTGLSLAYFPDVHFPWLQIHQKVIPGIVRLLHSRGYKTLAVHGNDPAFWNRTSAFKSLGFDKFVSINDFPPNDRVNDGKYMSDKSFTDEMLRVLKSDGPPQFLYGLSIEAHGPYEQSYGIDTGERDAIALPKGVHGATGKHLQNYIYHIRHADQQLGRLVAALEKRKRRTIVVFFGDHLPALVPAFKAAGFRNGKGFLVQTVPYLVFDTGHPDARPVKRKIAAWMLPGMALAEAGIRNTPYYALTDILGPELADLTRAPDAPHVKPTPQQEKINEGLRNVSRLQLKGKLAPLWKKAAAMAGQAHHGAGISAAASTPATSSSR